MLSQITARHNSTEVIPSYFFSIFWKLIVAVAQSRSSRRAIGQAVSVLNLSFDRTNTATRRRGGQRARVSEREGNGASRIREEERERKEEGEAEGK